jgi:hypothetical protein
LFSKTETTMSCFINDILALPGSTLFISGANPCRASCQGIMPSVNRDGSSPLPSVTRNLQSGGGNPFKIRRNRPRNRCNQLITEVILAMGSLLVEVVYLDENKCLIVMGSFAPAGRDLHPCRPSASDRSLR